MYYSLDTGVHRQGGALDEGLSASAVHADERPLVCVDAEMTRKIALTRKRAITVVVFADEWPDHDVVAGADLVAVVHKLFGV